MEENKLKAEIEWSVFADCSIITENELAHEKVELLL